MKLAISRGISFGSAVLHFSKGSKLTVAVSRPCKYTILLPYVLKGYYVNENLLQRDMALR